MDKVKMTPGPIPLSLNYGLWQTLAVCCCIGASYAFQSFTLVQARVSNRQPLKEITALTKLEKKKCETKLL